MVSPTRSQRGPSRINMQTRRKKRQSNFLVGVGGSRERVRVRHSRRHVKRGVWAKLLSGFYLNPTHFSAALARSGTRIYAHGSSAMPADCFRASAASACKRTRSGICRGSKRGSRSRAKHGTRLLITGDAQPQGRKSGRQLTTDERRER